MMIALAAAFALTAFIYSLAGFAGGSTYLALLVWFGVPTLVSPIIALTCNAIVSSIASARYVAAGMARPRLLIPAYGLGHSHGLYRRTNGDRQNGADVGHGHLPFRGSALPVTAPSALRYEPAVPNRRHFSSPCQQELPSD